MALIKLETMFSILVILSLPCLYRGCTNQDKETLLSFVSTLSTPIHSWNSTTNSNCCNWEGITCNSSGSITQLSLPSKSLIGEISPFLSNLTNLSYLNLSRNSLFGPVPQELLSLSTSLTTLDLSFNSLTGPIQYTESPLIQVLNLSSNFLNGSILIINSTSLVSLNVSNNSLTGPIPESLCTLSPSLTSLDISYNSINGIIAEEIGNCSLLRLFRASYNKLHGSLPINLFHLNSLDHLGLTSNRIRGTLNEYPISQLTNLVILDLGTNKLTGFIPRSIGQLKSLQYLILGDNNLRGAIPPEIGNCTSLRHLDLRANNLTGDLQSINFTGLSSLTQLDLFSNNLIGEIPETIYTCKELNALRLSQNSLSGQISPEIRNLKSLSFLSLGSNKFTNLTGTLQILSYCKNLTVLLLPKTFLNESTTITPNWETGLENIRLLSLGGCYLTGTFPFWILKMSKLTILDLSNNSLTGPVPDWVNAFPKLIYLDLSNNYLTGHIPQQITDLPSLDSDHEIKELDPGLLVLPIYSKSNDSYKQLTAWHSAIILSNNSLSGTIPLQIGRLRMLSILDLSGNSITGLLPDTLGNLTNLETMDLSRNNLTGFIPVSLTRLHFLARFSVAFNDLKGPVPTGGQFDTFSNSSYEGNTYLCGTLLSRQCNNTLSKGENNTSIYSEDLSKMVIALTFGIFFGVVLLVFIFAISFVVFSKGNI